MSAHHAQTNVPWVVDRRVFMGTFATTAAVSLLPLTAAATGSLLPDASAATFADWHIDDQWGPRYADPIAYGRPAMDNAIAE